MGEECSFSGCVPVASTVLPHIQTASVLLRPHLDAEEISWRAAHFDLLVGSVVRNVETMRAVNPNVRMFEYLNARYDQYGGRGAVVADWANQNGHDPEEFYMHYREDVESAHWASDVLVDGFPPGVIPGWNPGSVPGDPPASATSRAMSRAVGFCGGPGNPAYMINVNYEGFRSFLEDFVAGTLDGSRLGLSFAAGPIDGVLADIALYYPEINEGDLGKTEEYYGIPMDEEHPYPNGLAGLYAELQAGLTARLRKAVKVMPNFGHVFYLRRDDRFSTSVRNSLAWIWGEVWLMYRGESSPTSGSLRVITYDKDYEQGIVNIVRQTRAGGRRILGARDLVGDGTGSDRGKLYTLALYYLAHNTNTFYLYEGQNNHNRPTPVSTWQWNPAAEFHVGVPEQIPPGEVDFEGRPYSTEHYELASGPDPYRGELTYHVLARRFTNALVLVKMLPLGSEVDDRSITTHTLDRAYALLRADGTVGDVVTQVQIRNNEGLILIPVE